MMSKEQIAHDLSLLAAKEFIETNRPAYKSEGFTKCVSDLMENYQIAYKLIIETLD